MITLLAVIHVTVSIVLIVVVLLQTGTAGDIGAAFGGMVTQTAFGPRGAGNFLSKLTTWLAVIFMATSILLSMSAARSSGRHSVLSGIGFFQIASKVAKPANRRPPEEQARPQQGPPLLAQRDRPVSL